MKRTKNLILFLIIAVTLVTSCGKSLAPSVSGGHRGKGYDSATFDYVYVEALKQKLMGNNSEALSYLEHCLKINPLSDAVYYQMAMILAASGDLNNSKKYIRKAIDVVPDNLWYLTMMSSLYYQTNSLDSAIMYYEKATKYFPDNESIQLTLGKMYSENKNYDKAIRVFDDLDKKFGVNKASTVYGIRNLMEAKRYDEAEKKTTLLLESNPDEIVYNALLAEIYHGEGDNVNAMEVYNRLIERNPDNPGIQLSLCDFLINSKKYDDLFTMLNKVSLNTEISREDKIALFARIVEVEELVTQRGSDIQLALMVLEASYPSDDVIPLLRPDLLVKQNRLKEASIRFEELIAKNPDNYYAWEKLLFTYLQLKDYTNLEKRGKDCATAFNRSYVAKILYANGAIENKNFDVALEELRKAAILAGDDKDMNLQILTMKADIYYRQKDFEKAFATFDEAMKLNTEDLTIVNNYAYYLAEQNLRLKEAEDMARKVIEKEKTNSTFLDTYGWVLYKRGKLKAAGKVMEEIISGKDTPDAEWFEHYGYILLKQKKCDKAVENFNMAIKLDSTKTDLLKEIENCKGK